MTCKQCKYITVCMAQADDLGRVFDPNYDGEHGCTDFAPFTNADRIRGMSDEELAWELMTWRCETAAKYHGVESKYPDTQQTILQWLQQPEEKPKEESEC